MKDKFYSIKSVRIFFWMTIWIVALFVAMEIFIASGILWKFPGLEGYMLRRRNDHWIHNAFEISKVKNRDKSQREEVLVFVGGSIGLSAIYKDNVLSEKLSGLTGKKIVFRSICSSYQTFSDKAKIVTELGSFDGTILIALDPPVFRINVQRQIETFKNKVMNKYFYLTHPPGIREIISNNGVDVKLKHRLRFFRTAQVFGETLRLKVNKHRWQPIEYKKYKKDKRPVPANKKVELTLGTKMYEWVCDYRSFSGMNLELLKEIIRIAHLNGNKVVLLNLPTCPAYKSIISRFNPHYNRMIRKLVREQRVGYIDLREAAPWKNRDFNDIHHLRIPGRKKLAEALSIRLSNQLLAPEH